MWPKLKRLIRQLDELELLYVLMAFMILIWLMFMIAIY